MLLELTADQDFFRETTAKFLAAQAPVDVIRGLHKDPSGFDRDFWRRGAELGWTSLLVSEERGGGSISGRGVADLALIAHEIGKAAAPGPFVPTPTWSPPHWPAPARTAMSSTHSSPARPSRPGASASHPPEITSDPSPVRYGPAVRSSCSVA